MVAAPSTARQPTRGFPLYRVRWCSTMCNPITYSEWRRREIVTALSRGFAACVIPMVLGAMMSLSFGCSNSSRDEQTDAGSTDAGSVVSCDPNTQPITLYSASDGGIVQQPVVSDGTVFIATTDTVVTVPVAGGADGVLAQESTPHGLAVLSGLVYVAGVEIGPR